MQWSDFWLQPAAAKPNREQQVQRHAYEVAAIGDHGKPLYARQFHMPLFGHANGFDSNLGVFPPGFLFTFLMRLLVRP